MCAVSFRSLWLFVQEQSENYVKTESASNSFLILTIRPETSSYSIVALLTAALL